MQFQPHFRKRDSMKSRAAQVDASCEGALRNLRPPVNVSEVLFQSFFEECLVDKHARRYITIGEPPCILLPVIRRDVDVWRRLVFKCRPGKLWRRGPNLVVNLVSELAREVEEEDGLGGLSRSRVRHYYVAAAACSENRNNVAKMDGVGCP